MKIRSVTCFYDPGAAHAPAVLKRLGRLAQAGRARFGAAGYEVQSVRVATPPFPRMVPTCCDESAVALVRSLEADAAEAGFSYISFGPALPELPDSYRMIPAMLAATQNAFFGGLLSLPRGVFLPAVRACGEVIAEAANLSPDGFANLRFAALARVPAYAPFLPAAYALANDRPAFSLALEGAGEVLQAFAQAASLEEARRSLLGTLENHARLMQPVIDSLAAEFNAEFKGFDFSPAPYPADALSLGGALEKLGLPAIGFSGSLAAAAFLADTLDQGGWPHIGFNGLMLPVLEDSVLARRSAEGALTLRDLLMFSAVCGTGLDTVPLPGDASPQQLAAVLLDVAALACRLNKPLTARLMPLPGKQAGQPAVFDFEFFAPGQVMDLPSRGVSGLLASGEVLEIGPRR